MDPVSVITKTAHNPNGMAWKTLLMIASHLHTKHTITSKRVSMAARNGDKVIVLLPTSLSLTGRKTPRVEICFLHSC